MRKVFWRSHEFPAAMQQRGGIEKKKSKKDLSSTTGNDFRSYWGEPKCVWMKYFDNFALSLTWYQSRNSLIASRLSSFQEFPGWSSLDMSRPTEWYCHFRPRCSGR